MAAMVQTIQEGNLGVHLVDGDGMTLYLFTNDERNVSNCSGGCAGAWPPLITLGDPAAGEGVNEDRLSSITREDGSSQVTYNGWPLYYFSADEKPGDANGQDSRGIWFVVTPDGGPVQTNAAVNVLENETLGAMLVEASGRTLYLFTNDERNVSNCSGGCAGAWPPLVTVDDPAAGDGVDGGLLSTLTREDGSAQVTYNGRPVYYYAGDEKPGDTNGHEVGGVWFAVSTVVEPADQAVAGGGQAVGDDYLTCLSSIFWGIEGSGNKSCYPGETRLRITHNAGTPDTAQACRVRFTRTAAPATTKATAISHQLAQEKKANSVTAINNPPPTSAQPSSLLRLRCSSSDPPGDA